MNSTAAANHTRTLDAWSASDRHVGPIAAIGAAIESATTVEITSEIAAAASIAEAFRLAGFTVRD